MCGQTRNVEQAFGLREAELTAALDAAAAAGGEIDLNEFCALFGDKVRQWVSMSSFICSKSALCITLCR